MKQPNNLLPLDLTWPIGGDAEQSKAMQTLWQAEVAWNAFIGIAPPPVTENPSSPEHDEEAA